MKPLGMIDNLLGNIGEWLHGMVDPVSGDLSVIINELSRELATIESIVRCLGPDDLSESHLANVKTCLVTVSQLVTVELPEKVSAVVSGSRKQLVELLQQHSEKSLRIIDKLSTVPRRLRALMSYELLAIEIALVEKNRSTEKKENLL